MKRMLAAALCLLMLAGVLTACGNADSGARREKLRIVTTIFPVYDWVCAIMGDTAEHAEITMLLDNGVDLHSCQPTAEDIVKISDCDMFLYVGGASDEWVSATLEAAANKDMAVVNFMEVLGNTVKEEEVVEGMEGEAEEGEGRDGEEGPEYDEHIWLSLKNAKTLCQCICDRLCALDSANAAAYKRNTEKYIASLTALDAQYEQAVRSANRKTVLFGDRFPFRYLADDYGLDYYAAFAGCSAETEASFETIAFLAGKVDALDLSAVLTIEGAQHKIAQTIINNTASKNQQILTMNSMQSTTASDVANGATYLSVMESNLDVLKAALK